MTARRVALLLLVALAGCDAAGASADAGVPDVDVDSAVGQGYLAVQARSCGQCHQSTSAADGVLSGQATPVPGSQAYGSNLTPDPDTGMDAWDAGTIATSVLQAVDDRGKPLCPAMPAYADAGMEQDEALAIAAYLQSLAPERHVVPPSACPPIKGAGGDDGG
ncbi:MAG TPA: c-type cytochrome [Polyangiaceae bacterium]